MKSPTHKGIAVVLLAFVLVLSGCSTNSKLPEDGFVKVPGGRVAFRVYGSGTGTPVLFIHGGPGGNNCGTGASLKDLYKTRPLVVYDQLGSGNSDRMQDMQSAATLPRFVEEVTAVRERLGLTEVHLVGHSWGASVALEYLLTAKPFGVRSVTFVGPLISTKLWIDDANALVEKLKPASQEAIRAAVATKNYDSPAFKAASDEFIDTFNVRSNLTDEQWKTLYPECFSVPVSFNKDLYKYMWGPSEFVAEGSLKDYDRTDRLGELKLPTMFLVGEFDEARPETVRKLQQMVPGSILKVIPKAGHAVNIDQAAEFNASLSSFMDAVERR